MAELVEVGRYPDRVAADLASAHLGAHGVRAFVLESASFNPALSDASGGVRLTVAAPEAELARQLLGGLSELSNDDVDEAESDVVRCPRCELEYAFFERPRVWLGAPGRMWTLAEVMLALLFGIGKKRWRCHKCGHVWDDPDAGPRQRTLLPAGEPRPVFRLRRRSSGAGAFIGLMFGVFAAIVLKGHAFVLSSLGVLAGALFGRAFTHDVCSEPSCRTDLLPDTGVCPKCHGHVAGRVHAGPEHYAASAAYRRALAGRLAQMTYRRDNKALESGRS
ncbi:MAG: hypothetical protein JNK04_18480 [Myxococcales bacterium]|nr:hypothetical protein [Myxococcales bacterium]